MPRGIASWVWLVQVSLVVLVALLVAGAQSHAAPAHRGHGAHTTLPDVLPATGHPCPYPDTGTPADCIVLHCAAAAADVPPIMPAVIPRAVPVAAFVAVPVQRLEGLQDLPALPPPRRLG